jgi:hypothetical protein
MFDNDEPLPPPLTFCEVLESSLLLSLVFNMLIEGTFASFLFMALLGTAHGYVHRND